MKRISTIFLAAVLLLGALTCLPLSVSAATEGRFNYQVYAGKATITSYAGATDANVTIPSTLGGYPVTEIGGTAFIACRYYLTSVVIPDSVTIVSGFQSCSKLKSVTFGNGVKTIEHDAFSKCTGLENINIPNSVTTIKSYAFSGCTGLKNINLPNNVTTIEDYAFAGCTGLENINIPNSVTTIRGYAFQACYSLTSIFIPRSVTTMDAGVFNNCKNLTDIYCEAPSKPKGWTYYGDQLSWNMNCDATVHWGSSGPACSHPDTTFSHEDATCTEAGYDTEVCNVCGQTVYQTVIPANGHSYGAWTQTKAPTCTETGRKERVCGVCGHKETSTIQALPHTFFDGVCTECGKDETSLLLGDVSGDGRIEATDYLLLKRYCLGTFVLTDAQKAVADVTKDGSINALDYMMVKRHVLGTFKIG